MPNTLLPVLARARRHDGLTLAQLDALRALSSRGPWAECGSHIIAPADTPLAALVVQHGTRPMWWPSNEDETRKFEWESDARYYGGPLICESIHRPDAAFVVALVNAYPELRRLAGIALARRTEDPT